MPSCCGLVLLVLASAFSVARGVWAHEALSLEHIKPATRIARAHQAILNGLGAAVGCAALWLMWCSWPANHEIRWTHAGLGLLAFIGLTGYLPWVVVGLCAAPSHVAAKVLGKIGID